MNARLPIKSLFVAWLLLSSLSLFAVTFTYDSLNRLTCADYGNGSVIRYTYDLAGNRLTYSGAVANVSSAPINDNFDNRIVLSGSPISVTGSNIGASKEPGEPNHAGNLGGKSVWWLWSPPINGLAEISTIGTAFNTVLGVYTGTTLSSLDEVARDDNTGGNLTSLVRFYVETSKIYLIAVDGAYGASGAIQLNVSVASTLPNLEPAIPAGWSDKMVIATQPGQTSDATVFYDDQPLFVSTAITNESPIMNATGMIITKLYVDNQFKTAWVSDGLGPQMCVSNVDYNLGTLPVGHYTIRMVIDGDGFIAESNENDNSYTKEITVVHRVQQPVITWQQPASITYGTPLSVMQLNASANVPGTFQYTPDRGAMLGAGNGQILSFLFTPADTGIYSSATGSVSLNVAKASLTVAVNNASRSYGVPNPAFTGIISGIQNGDNITATYGTAATSISLVGTYAIVPLLLDPDGRLPNYTVTINNGVLTVTADDIITLTSRLLPNQGFQLTFTSLTGRNHCIEVSTDLKEWTALTNLFCTDPAMEFIDVSAVIMPQRFYRVVAP